MATLVFRSPVRRDTKIRRKLRHPVKLMKVWTDHTGAIITDHLGRTIEIILS